MLFCTFSTMALADYTLVVPSKPGTGTSIYAHVIAKELSKHLNENVIVESNGAAKGRVAIEKFNTTYKDDPKAIMLVHGGNANQYLIQNVGYDFKDWSPVMIQPYIVVTSIRPDFDWQKNKLNLADCSGCMPESMAWLMLKKYDNINYVLLVIVLSQTLSSKLCIQNFIFQHLLNENETYDYSILVNFLTLFHI